MIDFTLKYADMSWGWHVGFARKRSASERSLRETDDVSFTDESQRTLASVEGAIGELAFCRMFGKPWDARVDYRPTSDLPGKIEVRSKFLRRSYMKMRDSADAAKARESLFVSMTMLDSDKLTVKNWREHPEYFLRWRCDGWLDGATFISLPLVQNPHNKQLWERQAELSILYDTDSLLKEIETRLQLGYWADRKANDWLTAALKQRLGGARERIA